MKYKVTEIMNTIPTACNENTDKIKALQHKQVEVIPDHHTLKGEEVAKARSFDVRKKH